MTNEDPCGHPTKDGDGPPCQNPATEGDHCWLKAHGGHGEPGRPTKLSYERQEQIAGAIEAGKSITSAARMAGINRSTVFEWLNRGESEKRAGNDNEWVEFYDRITRAKGYGEDFYFNLAIELARENGDHRFIASLMKNRYGESWGEADMGVDAERTVIELPESVTSRWQRQTE